MTEVPNSRPSIAEQGDHRASLDTAFSPKEYWENRLTRDFSLQGVGYSRLGRQYNQWQYRLRDRVLRRQISNLQLDLSNKSVLDVGSGTGFYIDFWRRVGAASVSGCDLTETAVSRLQQMFPDCQFHRLDISADLSAGVSARFDVVSAFDIVFHIVDQAGFEKAFHNMARLLVPGGLLCFTDLFLHHATERDIHVAFRSISDVERVLTQSGFEILVRRPAFVLMNEPRDTPSPAVKLLWKLMLYPARKSETFGGLLGACLYSIDLLLTKLLRESPTTEIMLCRKVC